MISDNITMAEATRSQTAIRKGIDNTPSPEIIQNMKTLAENVFEPVRKHFGGKPIAVTSFYRSPALNEAIGGSALSQHCHGTAMDIDCDVFGGISNTMLFNYIRRFLEFDQLIWEFSNPDGSPAWVHVSFVKGENRRQVLKADRVKGKVVYQNIY